MDPPSNIYVELSRDRWTGYPLLVDVYGLDREELHPLEVILVHDTFKDYARRVVAVTRASPT